MAAYNQAVIRVFDQTFKLIGEIDNYSSLIYTRKWQTYNEFETHISTYDNQLMQRGNFILINNDRYRSGVIEYIEDNEKETKDVILRGYCPRFLLFSRPGLPPAGQEYDTYNTQYENVIYGLIDKNCVNPANKNRVIPYLSCASSQNRGDIVSFQTTYKVIGDEISSLSTASRLGTAIRFEPQNDGSKLIFEVLEGIDRTYDNTERPPYVFARKWDRISERNYTESSIDYKNCAYVAGQGEGADREIVIIGNELTGFERREVFIDARDVSNEESDSSSTLEDRGKIKLADYALVKSFEATVKADDYREKWDLGDLVTIEDDKTGIRENRQIIEVQETYENGEYRVEPTMGEAFKGIAERMKRDSSQGSAVGLKGDPGKDGQDGKTARFEIVNGHLFAIYD